MLGNIILNSFYKLFTRRVNEISKYVAIQTDESSIADYKQRYFPVIYTCITSVFEIISKDSFIFISVKLSSQIVLCIYLLFSFQ